MATPTCKIARENGGDVPLACLFGCHRGCHEEIKRDDDDGVTCRQCGTTGLHWQKVVSADGKSERPVLFDKHIRRHECDVADEFDVVED